MQLHVQTQCRLLFNCIYSHNFASTEFSKATALLNWDTFINLPSPASTNKNIRMNRLQDLDYTAKTWQYNLCVHCNMYTTAECLFILRWDCIRLGISQWICLQQPFIRIVLGYVFVIYRHTEEQAPMIFSHVYTHIYRKVTNKHNLI